MSKKTRDEHLPESGAAARWSDYFWVWLVFAAFIVVLSYATYISCQAPGDDQVPAVGMVLRETLVFFAVLMVGGFSVALLFDAAYEFFAGKAELAPESQDPPQA